MTLQRLALSGAMASLVAALLAACAPSGGNTLADRALRTSGFAPRDGAIGTDPGEMQALMRSETQQMVLRIPERNLAVSLLAAGKRDGVIRWRATDNAQIYTRKGMIIGTRGLGDDLMSVDADALTALILNRTAGQAERIHRQLDGVDRMVIKAWICDITPVGEDTIRTGEATSARVQKITETCHGPRGTFTNIHWVGPTGIIQSHQFPDAVSGAIEILFLP